MKVKDLIAKLKTIDPELNILCYSEDESLVSGKNLIRLLEIDSVDVSEGEISRDDNGELCIKIGKGEYSSPVAFINLTVD